MTNITSNSDHSAAVETARDGTPLRHPDRVIPKYRPLVAYHHFRELLKDKEDTSHVFRIFEALPHKGFMPRVRRLVLSEQGERLRAEEPYLPPILDDHETLRKLPKGTVAHAYCDFMESEGLSAAGLVAESERLGRPKHDDLVQWYSERSRDTHDLFHVATHVTHLGELGGFNLDKRRAGQFRQAAADFGFAHASRPDHEDILRRNFLTQAFCHLFTPPAVSQSNRNSTLGIFLANNVTIQLGNDFTRRKL